MRMLKMGKKTVVLICLLALFGVGCTKKKEISLESRFLNFGNSAEPEYLDPGLQQGVVEQRIAVARL